MVSSKRPMKQEVDFAGTVQRRKRRGLHFLRDPKCYNVSLYAVLGILSSHVLTGDHQSAISAQQNQPFWPVLDSLATLSVDSARHSGVDSRARGTPDQIFFHTVWIQVSRTIFSR